MPNPLPQPPESFDPSHWIDRWDRMQARYLVARNQRFETIAHLTAATQPSRLRVLDIGCGPGCLSARLLEKLPQAEVTGVDFDPVLLSLAGLHLERFGDQVKLVLADLRRPDWAQALTGSFHAVVSSTALHWLAADDLVALYGQISQLLYPGGIFLNADHAGSPHPPLQSAWETHRQLLRNQEGHAHADDWRRFWEGFGQAWGMTPAEVRHRVEGHSQKGAEEGLPLVWHLDALRIHGFRYVDCFWRSDCDAIYGGIR
ncbi:MAG: class I SAM-dependent methyltransferase [Anaerolineaceae bacterium]|nr:class I SAM-dependent methyltransferase [Anaerolineaceae bacterium]